MESRSLRAKIAARLALVPLAWRVRRTHGKGLWTQIGEIARLRLGPTRLRAAEYYDFRLWERSRAAQREYAGGWLTKQIYRRLVNRAWEVLMTDKLAQSDAFAAMCLPHPRVYAVAARESRLAGETPCFTALDPLARFLRREIPYPFFVKPVKGNEGTGCLAATHYDAVHDRITIGCGRSVGVTEFLRGLVDPTGYGLLLQERLETHRAVGARCGGAVSSVRMVVLLGDDGPRLFHADWAVPGSHPMISNFAKGAAGNLIGGLDLANGRVTRVVAGVGSDQHDLDRHPVTGRPLRGFRLPDWDDAVALCLRAATGFPGARWQNWDVALTTRGPVLLELNSAGDLYAAQYITGHGMYTRELRDFIARHGVRNDHPVRPFAGAPTRRQVGAA